MMTDSGIADPTSAFNDLCADGLLAQFGQRFGLSVLGARVARVFATKSAGSPTANARAGALKIVRHDMTGLFFQTLCRTRSFDALYLCSPWLTVSSRQRDVLLRSLATQAARRGRPPRVAVLTRPTVGTQLAPSGADLFRAVSGAIFVNSRLHTKLYICQSDSSLGSFAIVGSQNLSRSNYLELGVSFEGGPSIIGYLVSYFRELCSTSHLVQEICYAS